MHLFGTSNMGIFLDEVEVEVEGKDSEGVDSTESSSSTYFLHYLLLKSTGYKPPQLRQTIIDPVPSALLNDL